MTRAATYDGIIIGAGHNGLILQAYLGKAGLKTLRSSARRSPAAASRRWKTRAIRASCTTPTRSSSAPSRTMPWYADLELERHGAHYIEPELNVALLTSDGRALEWWTDIERTIASFEPFSKRDAETLRRWHDEFVPIVRDILQPESRSPPLPREERAAQLKRTAAGRHLLEVSALSPLEFVHQEFEHPTVQAGLLFFNGLREVDLRVRGFGHHIAALLASPAKAQMSRGGSAALARALEAAVRESGGEIRADDRAASASWSRAAARSASRPRTARSFARATSWPRRSIRIRPFSICSTTRWCRASSRSGRRASNTTCWRRCLRSISICASRRATRRAPIIPSSTAPSWSSSVSITSISFRRSCRHHEAGTIPPTVMWGACPTVVRSEPGAGWPAHRLHVGKAALSAERRLRQLGSRRRAHGEAMLDLWRQSRAQSRARCVRPLHAHAARHRAQPSEHARGRPAGRRVHQRPDRLRPAVSRRRHLPRRTFPGLYLCGSSSHPGGNITGLPGYNAAQVLLADLGIKADWISLPVAV